MVKNIMSAILRAFLTSFILILLFAMIVYTKDISDKIVGVMVVVTYFFSTLLGGLHMGKKVAKNKFLWGIIVGVAYFIILFLFSLIGKNDGINLEASVIIGAIVSIIGGMIGGMIS